MINKLIEFISSKFNVDDTYLPDVHRTTGSKPVQEDWWLYEKLGVKIPRWAFTAAQVQPPRVVAQGGLDLEYNHARVDLNDEVGFYKPALLRWPEVGPKPYQSRGRWYIAICYFRLFGFCFRFLYFTVTLKNGNAIRIGPRWSEGPNERYYALLGFGTKYIKEGVND